MYPSRRVSEGGWIMNTKFSYILQCVPGYGCLAIKKRKGRRQSSCGHSDIPNGQVSRTSMIDFESRVQVQCQVSLSRLRATGTQTTVLRRLHGPHHCTSLPAQSKHICNAEAMPITIHLPSSSLPFNKVCINTPTIAFFHVSVRR